MPSGRRQFRRQRFIREKGADGWLRYCARRTQHGQLRSRERRASGPRVPRGPAAHLSPAWAEDAVPGAFVMAPEGPAGGVGVGARASAPSAHPSALASAPARVGACPSSLRRESAVCPAALPGQGTRCLVPAASRQALRAGVGVPHGVALLCPLRFLPSNESVCQFLRKQVLAGTSLNP